VQGIATGRSATEQSPGALAVGLGHSTVPARLRVSLLDFFSRRCRIPHLWCRILPVLVTFRRFDAPLCVLFFGMFVLIVVRRVVRRPPRFVLS